jgi:hypothetical protein
MDINTSNWQFSRIVADDPQRASRLEAAPSSADLAEAIISTFSTALTSSNVRIGLEEDRSNPNASRTVLQFHIGVEMFDWFCNARTGYRAQFRSGWETGLAYNFALMEASRQHVQAIPHATIEARHLRGCFEDCGSKEATVGQLVASLDPCLSKLWDCTVLIQDNGPVNRLDIDFLGPHILLEQGNSWLALYCDDSDAWLEVKGAFLGAEELYQIKNPVERAKKLQLTGTA